MIRSRTKGLFNAYIMAQSLALVVSFWGYFLLLTELFGMQLDPTRYFSYSLIALFGLLIHLFGIDLTSTNLLSRDALQSFRLAVRQVVYVFGAIMFMVLLTKDTNISRFFLLTYIPILGASLIVVNLLVPRWLCAFFFSGRRLTRTLLVGPAARVSHIARWLKVVENYGVGIVGIVNKKQEPSGDIPVLGTVDHLDEIIRNNDIHSVLLLEIPEDKKQLNHILEACESAGARLSAVNSLSEVFQHSLRYFHHFGFDFVSLHEEPLEDPISRLGKRLLDVLISLPLVLLVLPILALFVAFIHRRNSPGPLLFRQLRTGIGNQPFEILKFRTMTVDNDDHSRQACPSDPRVFCGAEVLRRTSIDEFPQFINVLRGEMSIVGPRPHMLKHDERFAAVFRSYHVRSYVKPGLTGLAQIRGYRGEARSNQDIRRRVQCDIEYIERWSPILDLLIILKTAWQVVRPPKTAY